MPAKKAAPKARTSTLPPAATDKGPCQIGVIPTIGDKFVFKKIGLTVFGNAETEVPIDVWGLDELAVARVRAATAGATVRRIAYDKAAFQPYYNPPPRLFRDPKGDLTAIVQQIAGNSGCARYVVITRVVGTVSGNQTIRGVGMLRGGDNILMPNSALYANVGLTVFDGQTFAMEDNPADSVGARLASSLFEVDPYYRIPPQTPLPATPEQVAGSVELRDATRTFLAKRLDKLLTAFFHP